MAIKKHQCILIVVILFLVAACASLTTPVPTKPMPTPIIMTQMSITIHVPTPTLSVTMIDEITATPAEDTPSTPAIPGPESPAETPTTAPTPMVIEVPQGSPPTLDGIISDGEWDSARVEKMSDGSDLLLMHNGGYLYVGFHTAIHDFLTSGICMARGNGVFILDSSVALGTAFYTHDANGWRQARGFEWVLGDQHNANAAQEARRAFLVKEGWLASLGLMGSPPETEFQISVPRGSLTMAASFLLPPTYNETSWWPATLDDDCKNGRLLRGDAAAARQFAPEKWATVQTK